MYGTVKDELATTLQRDRGGRSLQARARAHLTAVGPHHDGDRPRRSTSAPTTTSAWPTTPRSRPPPRRRCRSGASAWPASASSAARRSCTSELERGCRTSSAPRTRSSTPPASTPTAASSRRCSAPRTRSSPTSSTTPRSSTASGCRKAAPATATATPTWPTCEPQLEAAPRTRAARVDRHRRRLLHGRLPRPAGRDLRPGRRVRRAGAWSTTATPSASSATGGRGTPERFGVMDRVDILTGTLGKALGGASGGYVSAHQEIVDLLRQRSRPYLFSNAVAPTRRRGVARAPWRSPPRSDDARARLRANTDAVPDADDRGRLRPAARRAPDHPGDVPRRGRRPDGRGDRRRHARRGRLRHRVLLPRGAAGQGADPRPALGGAHRGGRRRCVDAFVAAAGAVA